jgi:hypothetical protein
MRSTLPRLAIPALLAARLFAQPVVAPANEPTGPVRGQDAGNYNITNSFEFGYRFHTVDGNLGKYRSDVNFGNGIRLLGSNLTVNSRDGHGRYFDEIVLTTQGLGNDPYQFANLRVQHNRLYHYDLLWRINDYFNPGLTISEGLHLHDTRRHWQDHDVTLLPHAPLKLIAGYSRNTQTGPALTTGQFFDSLGSELPLFSNVHRRQTEYRLGGDLQAAGFRFIFQRAWQRFEEDTPIALPGAPPLSDPAGLTSLASLRRTEPYRGDTPFWRFHLLNEKASRLSINARYSYAGSRRNFLFDETAAGTDRFGLTRNRQILISGAGRRPVNTGSLTLSFAPIDRIVLTNHTAFHQVQMDGDSLYQEINNNTPLPSLLRFQFLGLRTFVNATDLNIRPAKRFALFAGYRYSQRRIRSVAGFSAASFSDAERAEQTNRIHATVGGIRIQPARPLSIVLEGELGRADRPFYPISERRYHALGGRIHWKTRTLQLTGATRAFYNVNSVSLFQHSSRARNYSGDLNWTPSRRFALDAGYAKQHLDTLTGLAYFIDFNLIENDRSLYLSNLHAGNLGLRFSSGSRADWYFGYSIVRDTGDGRAGPSAGPVYPATGIGATPDAFRAVQTFPLRYESPWARISIRIHAKLRWNFGYQHYRYREDFLAIQNYRAHTGFSSLSWSF